MWPFSPKPKPTYDAAPKGHSSDAAAVPIDVFMPGRTIGMNVNDLAGLAIQKAAPKMPGVAMDDAGFSSAFNLSLNQDVVPEVLFRWYATQSFIGYQTCSIIAQNWLVDRACTIPARDAIMNGYDLATPGGEEITPDVLGEIRKLDRKYGIKRNLIEFDRYRKIFGTRLALFLVHDATPEYYEQPFNIDGIGKGRYKGISQIDPYWITPFLDAEAVSDPMSMHFYEPTYWQVNGKRIHRSHFIKVDHSPVSDVLKPTYNYGGIPLVQQIMQRVYAAERSANETPMLLTSMRSTVLQTDLAQFVANQGAAQERMEKWAAYRDNYGIKVASVDEVVNEFSTTLSGLDQIINNQYNLVASIAEMPVTKLMQTTPTGLNATGDHEMSTYYDSLRVTQEEIYNPILERHYQMLIASEIGTSEFGELVVNWQPMESPSALERSQINTANATTDKTLFDAGAIDGVDIRERIIKDPDSGYGGIEPFDDEQMEIDEIERELAAQGGGETQPEAVEASQERDLRNGP